MAVDLYSLCPCGSGKKLKFCCADLVHDIEKIHNMVDGDQPRAALGHVEQTLAKHPGRASLLDLKAMLELSLDQLDDAEATLREFLEKDPENPAAHAQQAVLVAAREGARPAVLPLQQAIALVQSNMPRRVLEAIGSVGHALLIEGNIIAARAHLWLYQGIAGKEDTRALQMLMRLNQVAGMPLPLRDHLYMQECPVDHPAAEEHDRAQYYASLGRWVPAAQTLEMICNQYPDEPSFAYNRGLVFGWLGDIERFVAGMHEFACGKVDPEQAIEAEALAQLLDPVQRDEPVDVVRVTYPIENEDSLRERFEESPLIAPYEVDPQEQTGDGPPPQAAYLLLDKPQQESHEGLTRENIPSVVGILMHYGRQTDRAERIELTIDKNQRYAANLEAFHEVADNALGSQESEDRIGESSAAEQVLSWRWHFPVDTPPAKRREMLSDQRRETILKTWPDTPRGALDGKTPREAAKDPAMQTQVSAAVLLLEQGSNNQNFAETFKQLREDLGLAVPGPIDPASADLEQLPLGRITRLVLADVSDEDLIALYRRAMMAGAEAVVAHLASEAVRRPGVQPHIKRNEAYQRMVAHEADTPKALAIIDRARQAAEDAGESSAVWDLLELELRIIEGESDQANELLNHLRTNHLHEPGVAEQLYQLLYMLGATPENVPMSGNESLPAGSIPSGSEAALAPAAAETEGGKIWTPDGEGGGTGKKLWTPT